MKKLVAGKRLLIAYVLVLAATTCACSGSQTPPSATRQPAQDSATQSPNCRDWIQLAPKKRFLVVGNALEKQVGKPDTSPLAGCLWSIPDLIADHIVELCHSGKPYDEATHVAFSTAIEYCNSKP